MCLLVTVRLATSVGDIDAAAWNACAGTANPFVSHEFLLALEESGSVGPGTGWTPVPIIVDGEGGRPAAIAPAYAKGHSQGEYVFDQSWAEAWERAGGRYYPKIQVAAPFSPVSGPRLLLRDKAAAPALIAGIETVVERNGLSSAHATFVEETQLDAFRTAGWLIRQDSQFHWTNENYGSFDDFLAQLSSRHRKDIRKERVRALQGVEIVHLFGQRDHGSALGRLLDLLSGYWRAQMGPALSNPLFLFVAGRMDGRRAAAGLRSARWRAYCGRSQHDRRGHALRALLGVHAGRAVPPFRAMLLSGDRRGDCARPQTR